MKIQQPTTPDAPAVERLLDAASDYEQSAEEAQEELASDGVDVPAFLKRVQASARIAALTNEVAGLRERLEVAHIEIATLRAANVNQKRYIDELLAGAGAK